MTIASAAVLAVSGLFRAYLAITADRVSLLTVLPAHGEMGTYNDMAAGRYIDTSSGPLYPVFLMFMRLFYSDGGLRAVFLIQGMAIVLCAAAAGVTASRLSNRTAGMAALLFVSIYPTFIIYGLVTLPVVFCIMVVFLMMLVLTADTGDGKWDVPGSAVSGILGAAALLLHPVMVFLLPGLIAAVKKRILMLSVLLLLVVPWGVRNSVMEGRPVPLYEPAAYGVMDITAHTGGDGWKVIDNFYFNISFFMKKSLERAHMPVIFGNRTTNSHILEYSFVVAAIIGLYGLIRYAGRNRSGTLFPVMAYALLTIILTRYETRTRVVLEPLLIVYASILSGKLIGRPGREVPLPEPADDQG
jgi:hypothetical protein